MVALAATMAPGTAFSGPCETAERGTYLSNVCWLIEEFSERYMALKVVGIDEAACTVTLDRGVPDGTGRRGGNTIHFARVAPEGDDVERDGAFTCWSLEGANVTGEGHDRAVVCGVKVKPSRVSAALDNLLARYCRNRESEF